MPELDLRRMLVKVIVIPVRDIIDVSKNTQGDELLEFLNENRCVVVNGRKGSQAFTCVRHNGCSVVDYGIVPHEFLDTMSRIFKLSSV